MKSKAYTIGADPEVFFQDAGGGFVNAYDAYDKGIVKGNKVYPEPTSYGAIQVDGMAIELNTTPTNDSKEFVSYIHNGLDDAAARLGASPSKLSSWEFEPAYLEVQHPLAVELGCDPDFNAWEHGAPNEPPDMFQPLRTAGGHLHIGWKVDERDHQIKAMALVKQLDYFLGLWSLRLDTNGAQRRSMYGKAGAFRLKPYGVEYRVLSNFWMFHPPVTGAIAERAIRAVEAYDAGHDMVKVFGTDARAVIDNGAVDSKLIDAVDSYIEKKGL